ncbi:MAG: Hsp20/alpha crystallin family protein [Spiribacter salinus]|uniref:Hsp20/alpha crystallin family protein n=1 Tax=Spiribacter salinus TaxID=1335746 RepID=A0A540VNZ8_9GAMM|nr:MAG: Hsp20/alpha crystallin family protein [Spiribacter salinus]
MSTEDMTPSERQDEEKQAGAADHHPIAELQRRMNEAFETFWSQGDLSLGDVGFLHGRHTPRTEVAQTNDGIEVTVELPGIEQSDVELSLAGDTLTIKGEKKISREEEKKGYFLSERSYGSFLRSLPLPPGIDAEKAEAKFRNGILTVRLPHSSDATSDPKTIKIESP